MSELSIIVPVYNAEATLRNCIESILKQTYSDFELILVDDGSTDESGKICDEFSKKDGRVKVVHKENGGAGSARNAGIKEARGIYVAFPDADDFCSPKMYETMINELCGSESDLVICTYASVRIDDKGNVSSRAASPLFCARATGIKEVRELWFKIRCNNIGILNTPWNKIYRKDLIDRYDLRFPNERRGQDAIFNINYYDKIRSVSVIDEPLYYYNVNDAIRKGKKFPKDVYKCFFNVHKTMRETIAGWGMYEGEYKKLCDNHFLGLLDECITMCDNPVWELSKKEKSDYLEKLTNEGYVQEILRDYCGNVTEIEDIISPVENKDPRRILKTLKSRRRKERLRQSVVGKCYRFLKRIRGEKQ